MTIFVSARLVFVLLLLAQATVAQGPSSAQEPSPSQKPSATQVPPPAPEPPATEPPATEPPAIEPRANGAATEPELRGKQSQPGAPLLVAALPTAPLPDFTLAAAPGEGATLKAGDRFSLNVKSRFQLRYQLDVPAAGDNSERELLQTVNVSTARLWFSGFAYRPEFRYMLQLAFAGRDYRDGATSPIFDAYIEFKAHRDFNLRAGQFFVPFDRLRTVREWALQMAERPRPVGELTLDRDVGVAFYSDHFLADSSPVAWRLGAFGGGGTNLTAGKDAGGLVVARVEIRPLGDLDDDIEGDLERRSTPGLALGGAVARNWNTNRLRSTTGPIFLGGTTDYDHAAIDLVFKWLGFALQGELLWKEASRDTIVSLSDEGASVTEFTRSARGWVAQASTIWVPPVELVGRLSRIDASGGTDPLLLQEAQSRGQEVACGVNYYLNGHRLKLQADWIARTSPDFALDDAAHAFFAQLDATF